MKLKILIWLINRLDALVDLLMDVITWLWDVYGKEEWRIVEAEQSIARDEP